MAQEVDKMNGVHEEHVEQSIHNAYDRHVAIHTDTYDIDEDALGNNLPKHYYMSPGFIGTVTVSNPGLRKEFVFDELLRLCVLETSPTI
jgi:hypothetical protein